jgi:hypothetical protein
MEEKIQELKNRISAVTLVNEINGRDIEDTIRQAMLFMLDEVQKELPEPYLEVGVNPEGLHRKQLLNRLLEKVGNIIARKRNDLNGVLDETDKCYLDYVEGYLSCTFNHTAGAVCLMDNHKEL